MPAPNELQRQELGDFLRAQRARLAPEAFGFHGGRRRTPGLRREEVAQLCGMSATWYTWIEQGRDVSVSPTALARLARILYLSAAERSYLFDLAGKADPYSVHPTGDDVPASLAGALSAIALPAYVLDRTWTARAWNARAERLFVGWLDDSNAALGGDRNLLRYVFLSDLARRLIRNWPERARRLVAEFRADAGRHLDDAPIKMLVDELAQKSADFVRLWNEHAVLGREGGERTFDHPLDGLLRYEQVTLTVAAQPGFKMLMLAESAG
jgi:transcriptional regulator with XRE-family HTH domain